MSLKGGFGGNPSPRFLYLMDLLYQILFDPPHCAKGLRTATSRPQVLAKLVHIVLKLLATCANFACGIRPTFSGCCKRLYIFGATARRIWPFSISFQALHTLSMAFAYCGCALWCAVCKPLALTSAVPSWGPLCDDTAPPRRHSPAFRRFLYSYTIQKDCTFYRLLDGDNAD